MGIDPVARRVLTNPNERRHARDGGSARVRSNMTSSFHIGLLVVLASLCALPSSSWAQTDPKASADEHFKRGVELFRDRRFGDAATEFEEAYRLSPAYRPTGA